MIIGGTMRFSQWDIDAKRARELIKQTLSSLSNQVDHLWVYGNKLTDTNIQEFIRSLPNLAGFLIDGSHFGDAWSYNGNGVLDHIMKMLDKHIDWVLFPDSDDLLPYMVRQEVEKADSQGMTSIEFPRIEPRDGKIMDVTKQVGGPHILGCSCRGNTPTWRNSVGFNTPDGTKMSNVYHCPYPSRHMRYATKDLIAARQEANYHEEYAKGEYRGVDFNPDWTWQDYERHFVHG